MNVYAWMMALGYCGWMRGMDDNGDVIRFDQHRRVLTRGEETRKREKSEVARVAMR
jgi:hypothetical protein